MTHYNQIAESQRLKIKTQRNGLHIIRNKEKTFKGEGMVLYLIYTIMHFSKLIKL